MADVINIPADDVEILDGDLIVKFSKSYSFEGKAYIEINLSGLRNLTANDMIEGDKYMSRSGSFSVMPELTVEYACFMASRATDLPVEFFRGLPITEAVKVKNRITNFIYGED